MMKLINHDVAFIALINHNIAFIAKQEILNSFLNAVYKHKAVAKPPRFSKPRRFFFMLKNIGLDEKQLQGDSFKATTRIRYKKGLKNRCLASVNAIKLSKKSSSVELSIGP